MSLKTEQQLEDHQFTEFSPRIYATGVYLVPMAIIVNGIEKWVWVADEFESDTYLDELVCPNIIADTKGELLEE